MLLSMLPIVAAFTLGPATPAIQPLRSCVRQLSSAHMGPPTPPVALVKKAATMAVCMAVALGSPGKVLAKGGGHGGGHSGGSEHVSMSRSYSAPQATPSTVRTPSRGAALPSATRSGSTSSKSSRSRSSRYSRSSSSRGNGDYHYLASPPPPPTVIIRDAPRTVIVDDRAPISTTTDAAFESGLNTGRAEAATIAILGTYLYTTLGRDEGFDRADEQDEQGLAGQINYVQELRETRQLMDELELELSSTTDPLIAAIERPIDGKYSGESAEDDAGDQAVLTSLTFDRDGRIRGTGHDGVDGNYWISDGRWCGKRVAWIERYDEGFQVALRGQVRPDGSILALWASSVGVGGSVELRPPAKRE